MKPAAGKGHPSHFLKSAELFKCPWHLTTVSHPNGVIVHAVLDVPVPEYPLTVMTSSFAVELKTVPVSLKPSDVARIDFPAMKLKLFTVTLLNRIGS